MLSSVVISILNWSEVWALFIPIGVWLTHRKQPEWMKPIMLYLWFALGLNLICDIFSAIGESYYNQHLPYPKWTYNTPFYNVHSIIRFLLVIQFFYLLHHFGKKWMLYILAAFVSGAICIHLFTSESLFSNTGINGNLFTLEALLGLLLCMAYYVKLIQSDDKKFTQLKDFWIVTGFTTYFVINFFVFLFYNPLLSENARLASNIWDIHNISYIFLAIFIAIALYVRTGHLD